MRPAIVWVLLLAATSAAAQRGVTQGQTVGGAAGGQAAPRAGGQATSQQAVDPKDFCTLEGRVYHAQTGAPVPRATVTLTGGGGGAGRGMGGGGFGPRTARTDSEGKFVLERVPPGTYRLSVERVGFLRQQYGAQSPGGTGAPINLTPGKTVRNLDIKLTPQGVILGVVVDDEGDPVPRATVSAYRAGERISLTGGRGGGAGQVSASALTNDIGEFRLAGLTPGSYIVVASAQTGRGGRGFAEGGPGGLGRGMAGAQAPAEEDLLPTYYPSTLDPAAAAPVQVTPGQETGGVTIALRKGTLYTISGRVTGAVVDPSSVRVLLTPRTASAAALQMAGGRAAQVRADGTFTVSRVAPGSYYLVAETMGRGGGRGGFAADGSAGAGAMGRTPVDVSGDVHDVVISLAEPVAVSGTIRVEGEQAAASGQGFTVTLVPAEWIPGLPAALASARAAQGSFKMAGAAPLTYYLTVNVMPDGSYLKSIKLNGQEVIDKGIDLTNARSATLDVTISPKGASVEGMVISGDAPAPGSYVLMVPDPLRPNQPYLNRSATSDQEGKFSFRGLAPGSYKLYAFAERVPEIAEDLSLLATYESKAAGIRVSEGSAEKIELKVLRLEDVQAQ